MNTTNAIWDGLLLKVWYTCHSINSENCILIKMPGERSCKYFYKI